MLYNYNNSNIIIINFKYLYNTLSKTKWIATEKKKAQVLLSKVVMHLTSKTMMMVLSTRMTVKMPIPMMKMLNKMMRKRRWIHPRREALLVKHLAQELVKQKKLRVRSWRTSHMISLSMSMTLKKLSLMKKMTKSTWMTFSRTPRTKLLQIWHFNRSSNNNHRNCHNVIQMRRMLMRKRKFREPITPPNLQTYKYLKTWKICSNISSDTNPKRSTSRRNWNHLSQITYQL